MPAPEPEIHYFTASDGIRLAYADQGAGLPLLCLSGLTRNMRDFDYVAPHLADTRLIRMDYRGRGHSQWSGADSYSVPREARDALELLDHLGIGQAAILGSSRGGLIAMLLGNVARDRVLGLCLNDVGPVLERDGLARIVDYVGRNPSARSHEALAAQLPAAMPGFCNVPPDRWLQDARRHYDQTPQGLQIRYDPTLRQAFLTAFEGDLPDLWPMWDGLSGLPMALIRGANSDLLSASVAAEMKRRCPDLILADVPGRAHIPWLDEPESLAAIRAWLGHLPETTPAP